MIVVAKNPRISQAKAQARSDRNLFDPALSFQEIQAAFKQAHRIKSLLPSKQKVTFHASPFLSCVQTAACFAKAFSHQNSSFPSLDLYIHNELSDSWSSLTGERAFPRPKALSSIIPVLQINRHSREDFKQLYIGKKSKLSLNIHYDSELEQPPLLQSERDMRSRLMRSFVGTMHGDRCINQREIVIVISHDCALQTFLSIFNQAKGPGRSTQCSFAMARMLIPKRSPSSQRVLAINDHQRIKIQEDQKFTEQNGHQDFQLKSISEPKDPLQILAHSFKILSPSAILGQTLITADQNITEQLREKGGKEHALSIKLLREIKNKRAQGQGAFSQKNTSCPIRPRLEKSASSSSLPRRADIKEKIALSKQSVFLSKRALSKKLRKPILLGTEYPSSKALPSLLKQPCKSTSQDFQTLTDNKLEKCLVRREVMRPILTLRSNTIYLQKMSKTRESEAKEESEKFFKRWRFFLQEDWEKA